MSPPRVVLRSTNSTSSFGGRAVIEVDADVDADEYGEHIERSEGSRLPELRTDGRPRDQVPFFLLVVVS